MLPLLLPTAYFPSILYVSALAQSSEAFIEIEETYRKQTLRNHCLICSPIGVQTLTVPVKKPSGNHTPTRDIRIEDSIEWQRSHWRTLFSSYGKSPYFLYYQDEFRPFFTTPYEFLIDMNQDILQKILSLIRVPIRPKRTGTFEKKPEGKLDLRNILSVKVPVEGFNPKRYTQVFEPRHEFLGDLSFLDLIFNIGPEASGYLRDCDLTFLLK